MRINWPGIILFFISCFACLLLLEIILRTTGVFLNHDQIHYFSSQRFQGYDHEIDYELFQKKDKHSQQIWTIGDSFTNGGNVRATESYPAHLFKYIEQSGLNYSILNLGKCEDPTWNTYQRLKANLRLAQENSSLPRVVIIMVGSADPFYYIYGEKRPGNRKEQTTKININPIPWYQEYKVYKAYRHIKLELERLLINYNSPEEKTFLQLNHLYNKIKEDIKAQKVDWPKYKKSAQEILFSYKDLLDGDINEFEFADKMRFIYNVIIIPQVRYYSTNLKYDKATKLLLDFIHLAPEYFWNDKRSHPSTLDTFFQITKFQSHYTNNAIRKHFLASTQKNKSLRTSKLFKKSLNFLDMNKEIESTILTKRKEAWKKIIQLSQKYKFELIIQNYPSDFSLVNQTVETIAKNSNLKFIDQHKIFQKLIAKHSKQALFADDNHLRTFGHELMARNIFMYLKESQLLEQTSE
ncbi:MAG: SGNH/GDSL hydrolase family protein [Bacteriovoracaceae bacterium]|jgi:lysophospholipase L1-like esterase|nr:SGNH/GDSL hydrolase family protein [Bacteriovoracaceae bacterium]